MTVSLGGPATGSTNSGHDALYAYAKDWETNGTLIHGGGAGTGLPRVTLADNLDQRIEWQWAIPVGWSAMRFAFARINEAAGTGNVKFEFGYKQILLGEGNVDSALTVVSMAALTSGGQFDWTYQAPNELLSIPTPSGGFGDKPNVRFSLTRLGAGGPGNGDTLAGGISIGVVTATRVDLT